MLPWRRWQGVAPPARSPHGHGPGRDSVLTMQGTETNDDERNSDEEPRGLVLIGLVLTLRICNGEVALRFARRPGGPVSDSGALRF